MAHDKVGTGGEGEMGAGGLSGAPWRKALTLDVTLPADPSRLDLPELQLIADSRRCCAGSRAVTATSSGTIGGGTILRFDRGEHGGLGVESVHDPEIARSA